MTCALSFLRCLVARNRSNPHPKLKNLASTDADADAAKNVEDLAFANTEESADSAKNVEDLAFANTEDSAHSAMNATTHSP